MSDAKPDQLEGGQERLFLLAQRDAMFFGWHRNAAEK